MHFGVDGPIRLILPAVSVIIPARGAEATIGRTLDALARQQLEEEFEVILALDGPGDAIEAIVSAATLKPRIVAAPETGPRGPGAARNRGAAAATAPMLAFTDSDCEPAPGWLAEGLRAVRNADLVQGAVRPVGGAAIGPFDRSVTVNGEVGLYETANIFVRRELFERLGGFEDWLPQSETEDRPSMAEDVLFGWRARRAGARTEFAGHALVHHAVVRRGARDYIAEHARLRYFPLIVRRIPELRSTFLYGRLFLTRRTAAFDLSIAAAVAAVAAGSLVPLLAALPYIWVLMRESAGFGRHGGVRRALATIPADGLGLASLIRGSVAARRLVL